MKQSKLETKIPKLLLNKGPSKKKTYPFKSSPTCPPSFPVHVTVQGIEAHAHDSFIELLPKNTVALAAEPDSWYTWWDMSQGIGEGRPPTF